MSKNSVLTKNIILKKNPDLEEFNRWSKKFIAFAKLEKFKDIMLGKKTNPESTEDDAVKKRFDELKDHDITILPLSVTSTSGIDAISEAVSDDCPEGCLREA